MITAAQIKAARALLGMDQRTLAEAAGLSLPTIQRMEASEGTVRGNVDSLVKLARHERIHVKVSAYYALGRKRPPYEDLIPMIRRLHQAYGPHRLMWGSDSPYQLTAPNSYAESLALVRERVNFWSDADRDAVLRKTAAEVYFS